MDQPASGAPENLLTVGDVAELFQISPKTVYNLVDRGELPHVRLGRAIRFSPTALAALTNA